MMTLLRRLLLTSQGPSADSQSAVSHFTVPPRAHSSGKHYPAECAKIINHLDIRVTHGERRPSGFRGRRK